MAEKLISPGVGVKCPVDDGRELIIWEWLRVLPNEFPPMPIIDEALNDCCWWLSIWSRGGDIGSAFILTGMGDEEGGGVLFDTAKWGIPLKTGKLLLVIK